MTKCCEQATNHQLTQSVLCITQVVSQSPAVGKLQQYSGLAEIQGANFSHPVIVMAKALGGMEDIPPGVQGVITRSATDVLSHVAIRARSQGVLLATCFDEGVWQHVAGFKVRWGSCVGVGDLMTRLCRGGNSCAINICFARGLLWMHAACLHLLNGEATQGLLGTSQL